MSVSTSYPLQRTHTTLCTVPMSLSRTFTPLFLYSSCTTMSRIMVCGVTAPPALSSVTCVIPTASTLQHQKYPAAGCLSFLQLLSGSQTLLTYYCIIASSRLFCFECLSYFCFVTHKILLKYTKISIAASSRVWGRGN